MSLNQNINYFLGQVETPSVVLQTIAGNLLHITPDLYDELILKDDIIKSQLNQNNEIIKLNPFPFLGQIDLSDIYEKPFGTTTIEQLFSPTNVKNSALVHLNIISPRSLIPGATISNVAGINIDRPSGRKKVTVSDYAKRISIDNPRIVIALADEIELNAAWKRSEKALNRTTAWFNELKSSKLVDWDNTFLFGVVIDGPVPQSDQSIEIIDNDDTIEGTGKLILERGIKQSTLNLLNSGANGIVIGGAYQGENKELLIKYIKDVKEVIITYINDLKNEDQLNKIKMNGGIPILLQGARSINDILSSLSAGVDLVSTIYPSLLTTAGRSLLWDLSGNNSVNNYNNNNSSNRSNSDNIEKVGEKRSLISSINNKAKKNKNNDTEDTNLNNKNNDKDKDKDSNDVIELEKLKKELKNDQYSIDLWNEKYRKDPSPLLEGCQCHACLNHSRAYIHHLLNAKEILAPVLLYTHNQHQLLKLFEESRTHIKLNDFDQWKEKIELQ